VTTPSFTYPLKGVVNDVDPVNRFVRGTTTPFPDAPGGVFQANYYEGSPQIGDIVAIEQMSDGSWIVVAGTTSMGGVFGVGGDGNLTFTQNTAAAAARTTSADGACASESTAVSSASGAFTSADIGSVITSTSFSVGRRIVSITDSTHVVVDHPLWKGSAMASEALTITPPIPFTKSGSGSTTTFTLQRNLYCSSLTLSNEAGAFLINTNGFGIFCNDLLYVGSGIIVHNDGGAASGRTAGTGAAAKVYGGGGAGGAGFNNSGGTAGAGTTASNVTGSIATVSSVAVVSGGGGGGGTTGGPTKSQFSPPSTIINAFTNGWPGSIPQAITLLLAASTTRFQGGSGGSGGGCVIGSVSTRSTGGGGGGGGGVVMIAARQIQNYGTIRSNGGAGGVGAITVASGLGDASGGGGGGGGGAVVLIYGAAGSNLGAVYALGGAAGGGSSGGATGGVGITQYVDTIDYSEGFPRRIRQLVTVPGGGAGGAAAGVNGGSGVAGQNGQSGLVWAIPL